MRRVAIITGGSRGIGFGIAQGLAKQGYALLINGVREEHVVGEALESLRMLGADVAYHQGDVSELATHQAMLDRALDRFGHVTALINNAGVAPTVRADLLEMDESSYDRVMAINLKGTLFLTKVVANYFVSQKKASVDFPAAIINISSISATVISVNRGEYCISKAGQSMVTQLFAARLGAYDIPVYEIRPGVTRSDMTAGVQEKYDKLIEGGLCVQARWGEPEDVGRAVRSLLAGDFPYSTGQVIMIDGGLTLPRL